MIQTPIPGSAAPARRALPTPQAVDAGTRDQYQPQYAPGTPLVVATGVVCHRFRRTGRHVLVHDGQGAGFQVIEIVPAPPRRGRARRLRLPALGTAVRYGDTGTAGPLTDPAQFPYWVAVG